jgi:hypothetical protein
MIYFLVALFFGKFLDQRYGTSHFIFNGFYPILNSLLNTLVSTEVLRCFRIRIVVRGYNHKEEIIESSYLELFAASWTLM